jgi:hypothetical protein
MQLVLHRLHNMSADQRRARVGGALTLLIVSNIAVWLLQLLHRPEMPLMILFVGKSASFRIAFISKNQRSCLQNNIFHLVRPGSLLQKLSVDAIIAAGQYLFFQEIGAIPR